MRRKNQKSRCIKRTLNKVEGVCKAYDVVQNAYADVLAANKEIVEVRCNVWLEGFGESDEYTSDFVCVKSDGSLMVRECVFRNKITRPRTAKLLDLSRKYWINHGVEDWGIVIDAEE